MRHIYFIPRDTIYGDTISDIVLKDYNNFKIFFSIIYLVIFIYIYIYLFKINLKSKSINNLNPVIMDSSYVDIEKYPIYHGRRVKF